MEHPAGAPHQIAPHRRSASIQQVRQAENGARTFVDNPQTVGPRTFDTSALFQRSTVERAAGGSTCRRRCRHAGADVAAPGVPSPSQNVRRSVLEPPGHPRRLEICRDRVQIASESPEALNELIGIEGAGPIGSWIRAAQIVDRRAWASAGRPRTEVPPSTAAPRSDSTSEHERATPPRYPAPPARVPRHHNTADAARSRLHRPAQHRLSSFTQALSCSEPGTMPELTLLRCCGEIFVRSTRSPWRAASGVAIPRHQPGLPRSGVPRPAKNPGLSRRVARRCFVVSAT